MWTRGKDKAQPGKFAFELWDGDSLVTSIGGFATAQEADRAAESAQRSLLSLLYAPPLDEADLALSDAEILAALKD